MGRSHKHNLSERSPNENNIYLILCPYILKTGEFMVIEVRVMAL